MKLDQLKPTSSRGTYVGLRVLDPGSSMLYLHCEAAGIKVKKSMFDRRLHTTVIYSRKHCPTLVANDAIHDCAFSGYDIFSGGDGKNVLVVKLNAPSVTARHIKLMADHGATYDHPVFIPHITLSYDYHSSTTVGIPTFDFPIYLGEEYVEELDLSCKS